MAPADAGVPAGGVREPRRQGAITRRTGDPQRALHNLLERDRRFTDRLDAQTRELGLPAVPVDVGTTEDELTRRVAARWGLTAP